MAAAGENGNGMRRVVITGMGLVSPLGNDVDTSWSRLLAGESGAAEITAFDHTDYNVHFACELKDFDPTNWIDRKTARRMDRFAQMILAAAYQAQADSGFEVEIQVRVACPKCHSKSKIPDSARGYQIRCGRCQHEYLGHDGIPLNGPSGCQHEAGYRRASKMKETAQNPHSDDRKRHDQTQRAAAPARH